MNSIAVALRTYISSRFLPNHSIAYTDDDSLLALGVVDVFGLLDLAAFLETRYYVTFDDAAFVPDDLATINKLVAATKSRLLVSPLET